MGYNFRIWSDKPTYQNPENVMLTAISSPWIPISFLVFDPQSKLITSKHFDSPDDYPQGMVSWTVPSSVFPIAGTYGAKAVNDKKQEVSVYFSYV